jgi:hypothetical protein
MFIKRDAANHITAVSHQPETGMVAVTESDFDDIQFFLNQFNDESQLKFQQSDLAMARVLEDVVNLLVEQGTIRFTDLPKPAQEKLLTRREMRGYLSSSLLDDDDQLKL